MEQLYAGIDAVFGSWNNPRAIKYRQLNDIRGLLGTAVNVQTMVFGNMGDNSATGVAFTRDPSTGENKYFYGEYLINAQGEDVVAGIRTPAAPIDATCRAEKIADRGSRPTTSCSAIRDKLEKHYHDMQDIEFTIEDGTLYMLQTRNGKRTAAAAVQIAVDMVKEKLITEKTAVLRVDPASLDQLLHPVFDQGRRGQGHEADRRVCPPRPGAATGPGRLQRRRRRSTGPTKGKTVILVPHRDQPRGHRRHGRGQGHPDRARRHDLARGRGGPRHGQVLRRRRRRRRRSTTRQKTFTVGGVTVKEGDWISLNGSTGAVYTGEIDTVEPKLTGPFGDDHEAGRQVPHAGRAHQRRHARTTPTVAVKFGAEGIGLCRTEHMFFEGDRIVSFRRLILVAETVKTCATLGLPKQRSDSRRSWPRR